MYTLFPSLMKGQALQPLQKNFTPFNRGGGPLIQTFLARVVFGAFCHNKTPFDPLTGGLKVYMAKNENHPRVLFDSLNEAI